MQVRTPRHYGEHSHGYCLRMFSHFNFTLSGFVINMEIKNEQMMKIKPRLLGSSDNKMSHDITRCVLSFSRLFHISSSLVLHHVIWLRISFFQNKNKGFVLKVWRFLLAKRAIWQLGSFRAAAKEMPDRMWPFQLFFTFVQVWKPLSGKPTQFGFNSSQVKVSFCAERFVCVSLFGLN